MSDLHRSSSFEKLQKDEGQVVEVEEEEEVEVEDKEVEEEESEDGKEGPETPGTLSEELFWKFIDFDDSTAEDLKAFCPRLTSIVSPSLSSTPTHSRTPSTTSSSNVSSQKSTALARTFLAGVPGP